MKEYSLKKWPLISWEPEILISGGLILALLNIQPQLNQLKFALAPLQSPGTRTFLFILSSAIGSLTIGFILHLIVRAFWLMKMGIAGGFKNPLNPDSFGFQSVYKNRIAKIDIHHNALNLGKSSSLLFSASFFFLLVTLGVATLSTILIGMSIFMGVVDYSIPFICALFILLLFDFLSLGYLKRTKLGKLLYPVLSVMYFLTLSFLYRDVYYYLIQNIKKPILIAWFIVFVTSSILIGMVNISEAMRWDTTIIKNRFERYYPNVYDDERKPYSNRPASISSYYQSKDVIRLFLQGHYSDVENALDNNSLLIKIDEQVITPYRIMNHTTEEMQSGYLLFLDVSDFSSGSEYKLIITASDIKKSIQIPFYKE